MTGKRIRVIPENDAPVEAVVCVVDRSGSMSCDDFPPSRLAAALNAVVALMDAKRAIDIRDRVAVVAFNEAAQVVADFDTHRLTAIEQAQALTATGSTNIHAGLELALRLLEQENKRQPGMTLRIVLLSDGGHNTGPHPKGLVPRLRRLGVIVDTVAIGTPRKSDYDEALLRELAQESGGEFAVVKEVEALIRKYRDLAQKKRRMQALAASGGHMARIRRIR